MGTVWRDPQIPIGGIQNKDDVTYQEYQSGIVYCIGGKCYETSKEIFEKYFEVRSSLGAPIANTNYNIGHEDACVQAFEQGVIIYSPDTGAWEQFGEIRKLSVALMANSAFLQEE